MSEQRVADQIVLRPVAALIPYARNPRTHSPDQIAQIAASIREFGFTNPILVDEAGGIIAGHGRVLAAQLVGMDAVPTIELGYLTEAQRRAYVIADNKLALNAGWNEELLRLELSDLLNSGYDVSLTGFLDIELAELLADRTEGLTDPDEAPSLPAEPVSRAGDLWICGQHRVLCGDSTVAGDVERVLDGVQPHLMVTDPPYGVDYHPDWRNEASRPGPMRRTIGAKAVGVVVNDVTGDWQQAWNLFPGDIVYVWQGDKLITDMAAQLRDAGFELRNLIVWAKSILVIGRGHYHPQHETCWYAIRQGKTAHWSGGFKQSTLWQIDKPIRSETGHSAQKPVECMRRPIENNSSPGQAVYDPFVGSGTTIIAAEMTGRVCHALEITPAYVDVAVKRWQAYTGEKAVLDGDGRSFEEIAAERKTE